MNQMQIFVHINFCIGAQESDLLSVRSKFQIFVLKAFYFYRKNRSKLCFKDIYSNYPTDAWTIDY